MITDTIRPWHSDRSVRTGLNEYISSWRSNAETVRDDQCFTAAVGVGSAVIGTCFAFLGRGTAVAIWVGLVTLCITPGCAVACWLLTRDGLTRAIVVFNASLTWTILVSSALAWLQVTNLGVVVAATAGIGGLGSAAFLIHHRAQHLLSRPDQFAIEEEPTTRPWTNGSVHLDRDFLLDADQEIGRRHAMDSSVICTLGVDQRARATSGRSRSFHTILLMVLVSAVMLFAFSAIRARGHAVGSWGLLPLLGTPFLVAVGLTAVVLFVALRFIRAAWPMALSALCLLLFEFNGTQIALNAIPLSSWTYKHFGVVDYLVHGGALRNPYDIYQQWPGFFAAAAELARISGSSPMASGNWAHLFFEALCSIVIFAAARIFAPRNRAVPYVTALFFFTINWEGQYYYSPQSTAFLLALLFQFFLLSSLEPERLRRPFRNWSWLRIPSLEIRGQGQSSGVGSVAWATGLMATFGAIVVTHQMSPALVLAEVGCLWLLGILRRPITILSLMTIATGYLLLHIPALQHNFVLNGFSFSNTTGKPGITDPSLQQATAGRLSEVLGLGMWGMTAVCLLSYRRRIGTMAIPAVLAFAPFSLIMMSDYQGEGIYRVFLFSSPWCALIMAKRLADLNIPSVLRLAVAGCWALFAGLGSAQAQDFGMWQMAEVPQSEITASAYFLDHAPPNAVLMLAAANFPSRLNGNYVLHNAQQSQNDLSLDEIPSFTGSRLKNVSPKFLAKQVEGLTGDRGFLVIAPSMEAYEDYYQFVTPGVLPSLIPRLRASVYWKLWYQNGQTFIFQALPNGRTRRLEARAITIK